MKRNRQNEILTDLKSRKAASRDYLRSLSPEKKIEMLFHLQDQYFQFLEAREKNGGKPVPERWQKWDRVRRGLPL